MINIEVLMPLIKQFLPYAQEKMGFDRPPKLFVKSDSENAANPLGKTAFYDPEQSSITLYITNRHPKDVMRSLSHELVHHTQNCNGDFNDAGEMGEGYTQNNPHMREMERQAYEMGNMCFRDWEDSIKHTIYFEHLQKGDIKVSIKDWKNGELKTLLSEAWGFKMDLHKLNEDLADKHRTVANTIEEEVEEEEIAEMCGPDAEAHGAEEVVVMGSEEDPGEAADPAERIAALMDELKGLLMQLTGVEDVVGVDVEEEPMEERRAKGRSSARNQRGVPDPRQRPGAAMQEKRMRAMVRKAIKEAMK
jgi:hypothetical protein